MVPFQAAPGTRGPPLSTMGAAVQRRLAGINADVALWQGQAMLGLRSQRVGMRACLTITASIYGVDKPYAYVSTGSFIGVLTPLLPMPP